MKTLGLIGGTSWHSTVEYHRYINQAVNERGHGNNTNPPLLIYNLNQQRMNELQVQNQWNEVADILADAATRLNAGGAEAILFCANTPHKMYAQVAQTIHVPILHIGDAIGAAIRTTRAPLKEGRTDRNGVHDAGWLHRGVARGALRHRYDCPGFRRRAAGTASYHSSGAGHGSVQARKPRLMCFEQIEELRRRGGQGIVLGCTEFPLIIKSADVSIPVFDTTALHSNMAVDFILGNA